MKRLIFTSLIIISTFWIVVSQETNKSNGLNPQDYEAIHSFDNNNINSPCLDIFRKQLELLESDGADEKFVADLKLLYNILNRKNPNEMYLIDSLYRYDWGDLFRVWYPTLNYKSTYDESGNETIFLSQMWDDETDSWVNDFRFVYSYNNNGLLTLTVWQSWNLISDQWEDNYQYLYDWDNNGNKIQMIYQLWDHTFNMWVNLEKNIYTYDGSNNNIDWIIQHWDPGRGEWYNYTKWTHTYDGSNNLLVKLYQIWLTSQASWRNSIQISYIYDNNNYLTEETWKLWQAGTSTWQNYRKHLYWYDNNGYQTENMTQDWETNTSSWINDYRWLSTYNNELIIELVEQDWSNVSTVWVNVFKRNTIWDENDNELYEILYNWNAQNVEWDYSSKFDFYYSLHEITGITDMQFFPHSSYPNPFSNVTYIEYYLEKPGHVEITIYNAKGKHIETVLNRRQTVGLYKLKWDASGFSAGLYYYRIQTSNGIQKGKLVLQ